MTQRFKDMRHTSSRSGQILVQALVLIALAIAIISVLANLAISNLGSVNLSLSNEKAFEIAEAGIEYYRWHLAHAPQDFTNGTGQPGPYVINYTDKQGVVIGTYTLDITPPAVGSTIVTVRSTGRLNSDPHAIRKIQVKFAYPSLVQYAVIANSNLLFDQGTEVFGPIHANGGIHFDGLAHNLVTSAVASYNDPDHGGQKEFGVHTHVSPIDPLPPAAVPERLDVFMAGRQFPVPQVDFDGITANLAQIKTDAQANGKYFGPSGALGYKVVLRTNDTFDIYTVTGLKPKPQACSNDGSGSGWGIWSVDTTTFIGNYPFPANGLIFTEDNAWVEGQINGAHVTLAAAKFPDNPSRRKSITVNNNLTYTNYDGQDAIGLIAQQDVNVGLYSADNLRIDAAMMAKDGRVGRYFYRPSDGNGHDYCGADAIKTLITVYGMIATYDPYGFAWSSGGVFSNGYTTRKIIYDKNLLTNPPPSFPLVSDEYQMISWEEVQ